MSPTWQDKGDPRRTEAAGQSGDKAPLLPEDPNRGLVLRASALHAAALTAVAADEHGPEMERKPCSSQGPSGCFAQPQQSKASSAKSLSTLSLFKIGSIKKSVCSVTVFGCLRA